MDEQGLGVTRFLTDRREFAKSLLLLSAPALIATGEATAQEPKAKLPEFPLAVGQALAEAVRSRYGKYLSIDELAEIRKSIDRNQQAAQRLAQVQLKNSDEPAFVFSADLP
jgi:hypothetical protein